MMNAYRYAILWHCPKDATPYEVALDYCETVEANIRLFLRDKTNWMDFRLEEGRERFPEFWRRIGAEGDLEAALAEFDVRHNAAWDQRTDVAPGFLAARRRKDLPRSCASCRSSSGMPERTMAAPSGMTRRARIYRRLGARHALRVVRLLPVRRARRVHSPPTSFPASTRRPPSSLRSRPSRSASSCARWAPSCSAHRRPGGPQEHVPGHARDHGARDHSWSACCRAATRSASLRRSCSSCCGSSRASRSAASSAAPSSTSPSTPPPGAARAAHELDSRHGAGRAPAVARGDHRGALGDARRRSSRTGAGACPSCCPPCCSRSRCGSASACGRARSSAA